MTLDDAFASDGPLARSLTGFAPRAPQLAMARLVADAIDEKACTIVEAGTGTGKTFAYLVPALLSGKKVVISTGTKALQEQLFVKDLPKVRDALSQAPQLALLKGRSNYLCLARLKSREADTNLLDPSLLAAMQQVSRWAPRTDSGDIAELPLPEDSAIFPHVTSTADNCLGRDCPHYDDCFLVKARKKAMNADVVVINHHLFFADMAIRDTGFGELIPKADAVIFDEAHQLPDIACQYFGESVSTRQIQDLCKDVEVTVRTELKDQRQLALAAERLARTSADMRLGVGGESQKGNLRQIKHALQPVLAKVNADLDFVVEVLKQNLGRSEAADNLYERLATLKGRLARVLDTDVLGYSYWFETTRRHLSLNLTPLSVADKFAALVAEQPAAWIFTSATLAVASGFDHFANLLGLKPAKTLVLDSPFDYPQQGLWVVPRHLPEANHQRRAEDLLQPFLPLINKVGGRTFILFTSHRMLSQAASWLEDKVDFPVFVQGSAPKRALLEQFVAAGNGILLGTSSFWEGVDVRGEALSCVIIDKLPFGHPDDPLLQARSEDCRLRGEDPFSTLQLPQAVIALKQGAGRLIRDGSDRGVLVICDNRLVNRPYGQTFVASLPPFTRTRDLAQALAFFD